MSKQFLTPVVLSGGLQLPQTKAGGVTTAGAGSLGVDASGNVVLMGPTSVVVDAGSVPVNAFRAVVTVTGVLVGQNVTCNVSGDSPVGAGIDELEVEPLMVYGSVTAANQVTFLIVCVNDSGFVSGQKEINFYVG
jgi:hypothetical protein